MCRESTQRLRWGTDLSEEFEMTKRELAKCRGGEGRMLQVREQHVLRDLGECEG